mgnify:FL=1
MKKSKTPEVKPKIFSLNAQEKTLLENQQNLKAQYDYLSSLIERDSYIYVQTAVKKRLGIGDGMEISWDVSQGKVFATPKVNVRNEEKSN